jgi:deoxyribodipyrimidine photo-lyase
MGRLPRFTCVAESRIFFLRPVHAMTTTHFPPLREAALARLESVQPAVYARTRNALDGAVTRLSPYLSHGVLTLPEVYETLAARHHIDPKHKLVYEFGWREFFHHVWWHRGAEIFQSLHAGPLPEDAYCLELPLDIRQGRTGVPVIDRAVAELYAFGYLHNHVRMWLASYVVHLRKVHWRAGADWLYAHLLDGDLASNHLSWQWVAGTGSHKPYLFNAENVAKYAPLDWHSPGSTIDRTYEALDHLARSPGAVIAAQPDIGETELIEPTLLARPPEDLGFTAPDAAAVTGCDVWLVHPWALRQPPTDLAEGTRVVAIGLAEWHAARPWSLARWHFVGTQQAALSEYRWFGNVDTLRTALAGARSVQAMDDLHVGDGLRQLREDVVLHPASRLFAPVSHVCGSFSQWWHRTSLAP